MTYQSQPPSRGFYKQIIHDLRALVLSTPGWKFEYDNDLEYCYARIYAPKTYIYRPIIYITIKGSMIIWDSNCYDTDKLSLADIWAKISALIIDRTTLQYQKHVAYLRRKGTIIAALHLALEGKGYDVTSSNKKLNVSRVSISLMGGSLFIHVPYHRMRRLAADVHNTSMDIVVDKICTILEYIDDGCDRLLESLKV